MNQPARKPGDPAGRRGDSLPVDDPSIPVLTERLTLPPLDLNLDFRLPERPSASEAETVVAPAAQVPVMPVLPVAPVVPQPAAGKAPSAEQPPQSTPSAQGEEDATLLAPPPPVEPPEPDDMPRVPTSLLVSNLDVLLPAPPDATLYREAEEFDITRTGGARPNRMETDLREMILLEIARRLPTEVEAIVRRHLEGAIEEAIRRFAAETRIALAASLREIVDRAVRTELDRINTPRNRDS